MPWVSGDRLSGLLAGFALALGLYNLVVWLILKQRPQLLFGGLALVAVAFFIDPSERALTAWVSISILAAFTVAFFDLPEYDGVLGRVIVVCALAAAAYPAIDRFASGDASLERIAWALLVITQLLVFVAAVRAMQRGFPGARFFAVAALGACASALSPDFFGIGLAWELLWGTVALADRASQADDEDEIDFIPSHLSRAELQVLAELDPLTGVPNRRAFDERIEAEWEHALANRASLGLIMIDVDHFKDYNDELGHVAGDVCLSRIAKACATSLKRSADFFARYGGEEFVAIVLTRKHEDVPFVAERMRQAVIDEAMPHPTNPQGIVTISLGTARFSPAVDGSPTDLIDAADAALYEAKSLGRNRVNAAASLTGS